MPRQKIPGNSPYEKTVGYSRAIRVGNVVYVAGTTATNELGEVIRENAYEQSIQTLNNIRDALAKAGATMDDVVRTRMFVVNVGRDSEAVGRAHGEFFKEVKPVATMVGVNKLVDERMLVEIEVEAVIEEHA